MATAGLTPPPRRTPALGLTSLLTFVLALVLVGLTPAPAAADPAGPTDYRSEIIEVDPPAAGIELTMIGGDAFIELAAEPGTEVLVVGYEGEPYLRFEADGTVLQNERSPARWLNDDRYGDTELPPEASADAEPEWVEVATNGTFAWHDHRTHWMNPSRPPGSEPGDTVLEAVVPVVVDGASVDIHVRSELLAGPSPVAAIIGVVAGLATAFGLWRLAASRPDGRARTVALGLLPWSVAALVLGAWAVRSVPAETGPSGLLWQLPLVATVMLAAALVLDGRPGPVLAVPGLVAVASVELLVWAWIRRLGVVRAYIPSDAPATVDRAVIVGTALVAVVGLIITIAAVASPTGRRLAPRP